VVALIVAMFIGMFQGSFVAIIGVPAFVVTLAGLLAWQGVIQVAVGTPIIIENRWINYTASYFFSNIAGWLIAGVITAIYWLTVLAGVVGKRRAGVAIGNLGLVVAKLLGVAIASFGVVAICNHAQVPHGLPLAGVLVVIALVILTFLAKRTTFGRHVYAVGGNGEAAWLAGASPILAIVPALSDPRRVRTLPSGSV